MERLPTEEGKKEVPFTSQRAAALLYLPVHIFLTPRLLLWAWGGEIPSVTALNAAWYAVAAALLLICLWSFFRREFFSLCDYGLEVLPEVLRSYGFLLLCNMGVAALLYALGETENPNNAAIASLAGQDLRMTAAVGVCLAPLAEEAMFRGGIFGLLRRYSRVAAYAASMLLFALYHVWSYALEDPLAWLYLLQYLPAGFLLARIYEKTNSLWASIFLHMTVNGVAMLLLAAMGGAL